MRIATLTQPKQNNEMTLAFGIKELTLKVLSANRGVEWECECILEALALGKLDLAARGLERYLGRVSNQFPLRSRSLLLEIARAYRNGDVAQAVACCKSILQYHNALRIQPAA